MASPRRLLTLVLVVKDDRVLLGMKKRGFGVGKLNGFGGKLEPGETIEQAARRELHEEAGIEATRLDKAGVLRFDFTDADFSRPLEVHVFRCTAYSGEPRESEEMTVQWQEAGSIPFDSMWPDDRFWFPYFLARKPFMGHFVLGRDDLLGHALTEVPTLDDVAGLMPRADAGPGAGTPSS